MSSWPVSIISPVGYSSSTCGYCRPRDGTPRSSCPKTSRSFGIWLHQLSPLDYQALCDRGWRRSGNYVYKPDLERTCCKQISIRLDTRRFVPSRGQREVMRRVMGALLEGSAEDEEQYKRLWGKGKGKGKYSRAVELEEVFRTLSGEQQAEEEDAAALKDRTSLGRYHEQRRIQAQERRRLAKAAKAASSSASTSSSSTSFPPPPPTPPLLAGRHLSSHLTTHLVPASSTPEKYDLFRRYQTAIHGESESEVSDRKGFERFLCKSSLRHVEVGGKGRRGARGGGMKDANGEEVKYGPYHMEWRLRPTSSSPQEGDAGLLVAISVLDLLPTGLSSVYLFYSPSHSHLQLGNLSALREILLTRELHEAGVLREPRYYMGFYIEGCGKMEYKARYRPSEVLDVRPGGGGAEVEDGLDGEGEWREIDEVAERIRTGQAYGWRRPHAEVASSQQQMDDPASASKPPQGAGANGNESHAAAASGDSDDDDDEDEDEGDWLPTPPPPGIMDPSTLTSSPTKMASIAVLEAAAQEEGVKPFMLANLGATERRQIIECVAALGLELASRCVFFT